MTDITLQELANRISQKQFDNVKIIPHIRPDFDCIGSALALQNLLKRMGKTAWVICDDKLTQRLCRVFGIEDALLDRARLEEHGEPDYRVCVDCASPKLIGAYAGREIDIVIDHHISNTRFGNVNYVDSGAAATGEIIYLLADLLGIAIDEQTASYLYCAISADCGSFKFSNTTPRTMQIAASLISTGIDFAVLNQRIYDEKSFSQLKAEQFAFTRLQFFAGGRIGVIGITREMMSENGIEDEDIDNLSDIPRKILGVEVAITLKAVAGAETESYKLSFRSNSGLNVSALAAKFNGGGHIKAAGGFIVGALEDCIKTVTDECASMIEAL